MLKMRVLGWQILPLPFGKRGGVSGQFFGLLAGFWPIDSIANHEYYL